MPNFTTVIPAMDHIDTVFTAAIHPNSDKNLVIHAAIITAKKTLDCYYSCINYSDNYQIAMGMCLFLFKFDLNISRQPGGNRAGSTLPRNWCRMNSIKTMPTSRYQMNRKKP